jgi:hypothetical protein
MKTITNIFISHLILLILFGGAAFALAQTEETLIEEETVEAAGSEEATEAEEVIEERPIGNTERAEAQENIQENIETRQLERQENQENREENRVERQDMRRANLDEQARLRITNLSALMSNRVESAIARMQNISDRIASRMEKLAAEGKDVSEAELALASANLSLEEAQTSISTIDRQVADVVGAEDVKAAWQEVRSVFVTAKDQLKTAQLELRNTISALKSAPTVPTPDVMPNATEADSTTPTN